LQPGVALQPSNALPHAWRSWAVAMLAAALRAAAFSGDTPAGAGELPGPAPDAELIALAAAGGLGGA
jgi:hypothetical protein